MELTFKFTPVDYDPFKDEEQKPPESGFKFTPVGYNPFEEEDKASAPVQAAPAVPPVQPVSGKAERAALVRPVGIEGRIEQAQRQAQADKDPVLALEDDPSLWENFKTGLREVGRDILPDSADAAQEQKPIARYKQEQERKKFSGNLVQMGTGIYVPQDSVDYIVSAFEDESLPVEQKLMAVYRAVNSTDDSIKSNAKYIERLREFLANIATQSLDMQDKTVEAQRAKDIENILRPIYLAVKGYGGGLTFGASDIVLNKLEKKMGGAIEAEGIGEMALFGASRLAGGVASGRGVSKAVGSALSKTAINKGLQMVGTRLGTALLSTSANQFSGLLSGTVQPEEVAGNIGQNVGSALAAMLPEFGLPKGIGNAVGQVMTDFIYDLTTDMMRGRVKMDGDFVEWFLQTELPQLANSVIFASMDLADPDFEANREKFLVDIRSKFRGDLQRRQSDSVKRNPVLAKPPVAEEPAREAEQPAPVEAAKPPVIEPEPILPPSTPPVEMPKGDRLRPTGEAADRTEALVSEKPAEQARPPAAVPAKPPELMTPEEYINRELKRNQIDESETSRLAEQDRAIVTGNAEEAHANLLAEMADQHKPLNADAVEAYYPKLDANGEYKDRKGNLWQWTGYKLPSGYVREGDRYVFKGEAAPKPVDALKAKMAKGKKKAEKPAPIPGMKAAAAEAEKAAKGPGLKGGPGAAAAEGEGEFAPSGTRLTDPEGQKEIISGTMLNKATAELERSGLGIKPADETERKEMAIEWNRSAETIKNDSRAPTRIIDSIISDPTRSISDADAAVLLRHKVKLTNDINDFANKSNTAKTDAERIEADAQREKALGELETLMEAAKTGLTTWGRTGRWAQMVAAEDYSLGNMLMRAKARKGGELTGEEKLKIQMLQKELEEAQKRTQEAVSKAQDDAQKQADKVFQDFVTETIATNNKPITLSEKSSAFLENQANKAMERIKERRRQGRMFSGIDPSDVGDYSIIGAHYINKGLRNFSAWSAKMVSEIGEYIKPYLKQIWEASKKLKGEQRVKDDTESAKSGGKPKAEEGIVSRKLIRELMRDEVESGVRDLDTAVRNVHDIVVKSNPDITLRQVRDTFSDYGKSTQPSQETTDVVLRDLRAQSQKVSQLEDIMQGKPPLKTGKGRDAPSQITRELTKQVHSAMKKMGITIGDPAKRLKSSLEAVKSRLKNSIDDLTKSIENRERLIVNKSQVKYDTEANALKSRRDALRAQYDEMFPKPAMTDEERYDAAVKTARRSLDQWESKLADAKRGVFPSDIKKGNIATKELIAIRKQRDQAKVNFEALRDAAMPDRKDKLSLAIYKKRLDRRMADIEERLKSGVLPKKAEKPERVLDEEAKNKMFELDKLQDKWNAMQYKLQLAQMSSGQKAGMVVREATNTLRALSASFDVGHLRRQGGMHFLSHPIESLKLIPKTLSAMRSEDREFKINQTIKDDPIYLQEKKAGLFFNDKNTGFNEQEEAFRGKFWREIPGLAASGRAYGTGLNLIRHTMFKRLSAQLSAKSGGKLNEDDLKTIANFINNWTGRGELGKFEQASQGLADIFFSPRLVTSRFKVLLAPFTGFRMYGKSKEARKLIAKEYARYVAGLATYWGVIAAGASAFLGAPGEDKKWNIEFNPLSSQFGKIRIGNTTIDPLSGLQQPLVFALKVLLGKEKTGRGQIRKLRGSTEYKPRDVAEVIERYVRSKLSPAAGLTYDLIAGKDYSGDPPTAKNILLGMTPMVARDIYEAVDDLYKEFGNAGIPSGIAIGLLSSAGEGIQTFKDESPAERRAKKRRGFWDWD